MAHPNTRLTLEQRLWMKVDVRGPDECWNWTAATNAAGLPIFRVGRRATQPSRYLWEQAHGKLAKYRTIFKKCENILCVNLRHHELTRSRATTTYPKGEEHHSAILTEAQVLEARRLYASGKATSVSLAEEYGVSKGCIARAIYKETWKHI